MENTPQNLRRKLDLPILQHTAFILFLALGVSYIILEILRSNHISENALLYIQKSLDLPFAFVAIIYATTSLRLAFSERPSKTIDTILILLATLIFIALLYLNLFLPDS